MVSLFGLGQSYSPYLFAGVVDVGQRSLWVAIASICFNPLYWNTVAQNEYRNKTLTKILGNKPYVGCYVLGASIFLLGILRDHLYNKALADQPANELLTHSAFKAIGAGLFLAGQVFVLSSMWALGFTGTYLGDYFGILMESMVTGFPFNVMGDPMYWGSSMCFAGVALWFAKPAGLLLSALVVVVYTVALRFEGPFTANIYAQAAKSKTKRRASTKRASTSSSNSTPKTASRRKSTSSLRGKEANGTATAPSPAKTAKAAAAAEKKPKATRARKSKSVKSS